MSHAQRHGSQREQEKAQCLLLNRAYQAYRAAYVAFLFPYTGFETALGAAT